jgi:hypothetical protein
MKFDQLIEKILKEEEEIKFSYPLKVYHGTDLESAQDIKEKGLNLEKCERGYFGKAFYVTPDRDLAQKNYADFSGDEEGGIVLEFSLNPIQRVLDLRDPEDWKDYKNLKYSGRKIEDFLGRDEFPLIMTSLGIDALYDRSNEAFAVYNLKILKQK